MNSIRRKFHVLAACAALGCSAGAVIAQSPAAAPAGSGAANVTDQRLRDAAAEPGQWMTYNGSYDEQRYSTLTQIDRSSVSRLGLAWFADYDTNLEQESTPLEVDGVIYVSTAWSKVYAFDARSGKALWEFNPHVPGTWAVNVCCGLVNRGVAVYEGKVYVGTLDGRLIAIDAKSGKQAWSVQTFDKKERYSITGAPRIVKGRVLIGNGGAEFGVRGYLSAYDARSGKLDWRFYLVPGDPSKGPDHAASDNVMAMAAKTWDGQWWKYRGGGTPWDSFVYDPKTNMIFIGGGNGSPWNARIRSPGGGDNLFLSSIVAVNADTGKYIWHYQETPWESWDYTATQQLTLADIKIGGETRRVLMQAPKNGYFYVLDEKTGKLLSANPYTEVNWADGVDLKTGRPRVNPAARYSVGKPFNQLPGPQGAHAWHPMAYSPRTGLVYIPVQRAYFPYVADPEFVRRPVGFNLGVDLGAQYTYYRDHPQAPSDFQGYLKAFDPVTGKEVWRGAENKGPTGGALATAGGLVFQGGGSSQEFRAYDARTGAKLWSFQAQTSVLAGPITYTLDGRQYVAVSVGGNEAGGYYAPNYSRLLVFALDGKAALPPVQAYSPPPLDPPPATASVAVVKAGSEQYSHYCAACHGQDGHTRGATFPDLTRTPLLNSQAAFDEVVLKGVRSERGMVSFANVLKPADTAAVRAFIIATANELKKAGPPKPPPRGAQQAHQEQ